MTSHEQLIDRAKERAETTPVPELWGYRVALEEHDVFVGRWRGETVDEMNVDDNGNLRRIYLLWDDVGELCFSRHYAALGREIDRVSPEVGCTIVVVRGADYVGAQGTGYSFGVETEPNDAPLPDNSIEAVVGEPDKPPEEPAHEQLAVEDDGIPF